MFCRACLDQNHRCLTMKFGKIHLIFRKLVSEYKVISEDELEELLNEIKYLQSMGAIVTIEQIANLVGDLVAQYPK